MKCHEAATLHRYTDDELDAHQRARFVGHLDRCALCSSELDAITDLRARLRDEAPRYAMPARLSQRIDETVARHARVAAPDRRKPAAGARRPRAFWVGLGSGAALGGAVACGAMLVVMTAGTWFSNRNVVDEVVAAHGRSSLTGHVVDVASSDQHTVRPWLSQRLDYSPPVIDLKDQGFPLLGGRLDRIEGASIATLIYRYGQHRIDVFVRPAAGPGRAFEATSLRGYNIAESRGSGMEWIGVSDVNQLQLQRLIDQLADPRAVPDSIEPVAR